MVTGLVDYLNTFLDYLENHFISRLLWAPQRHLLDQKCRKKKQ